MERQKRLPIPGEYQQRPLLKTGDHFGGEKGSFSDLNAPHEPRKPYKVEQPNDPRDIPYTLPARLIAPTPEIRPLSPSSGNIFEADLENSSGNEGRGPGFDYEQEDR